MAKRRRHSEEGMCLVLFLIFLRMLQGRSSGSILMGNLIEIAQFSSSSSTARPHLWAMDEDNRNLYSNHVWLLISEDAVDNGI